MLSILYEQSSWCLSASVWLRSNSFKENTFNDFSPMTLRISYIILPLLKPLCVVPMIANRYLSVFLPVMMCLFPLKFYFKCVYCPWRDVVRTSKLSSNFLEISSITFPSPCSLVDIQQWSILHNFYQFLAIFLWFYVYSLAFSVWKFFESSLYLITPKINP